MNLLETILQANNGNAVRELSGQFGLGEDKTLAALQSILPALAGGLQRNASQQGGLESLMGALTKGNHQQYLENPSVLAADSTRQDGNNILGHILGSKDVSRQVAAGASAKTGVGTDVLKSMLPIVAAMAMGALKKGASPQGEGAAVPGTASTGGQGLLGMLTPLLDRNQDGSVADDVLGMVGKMFSR